VVSALYLAGSNRTRGFGIACEFLDTVFRHPLSRIYSKKIHSVFNILILVRNCGTVVRDDERCLSLRPTI
jgi:hypothetical protein